MRLWIKRYFLLYRFGGIQNETSRMMDVIGSDDLLRLALLFKCAINGLVPIN